MSIEASEARVRMAMQKCSIPRLTFSTLSCFLGRIPFMEAAWGTIGGEKLRLAEVVRVLHASEGLLEEDVLGLPTDHWFQAEIIPACLFHESLNWKSTVNKILADLEGEATS